MEETLIIVTIIAVIWHLGIFIIMKYRHAREYNPSMKRLLRLVEIDLLEELKKKLNQLPRRKAEEIPYENELKVIEQELRRLRKDSKKLDR
ncbi:hypothetical protein AKJ52_00535 [candidate division MSBL1 archaeon SCGC-AAA382C18]|uniref:Uncharacterized protein n=1 Tax=candidate division MSBL1 archaeon SCGC-AAA382C18 TaxID=1698281 RepID=A0A133VLP6_9EURY|nr:hypothetical protein AKJ52_00535 [candidate division MSBL1 archaeon SCGC-AAA382C18]